MKETYLQSVQAYLDCPAAEKERLMERITRAVEVYLDDMPESSMDELTAEFGSPEACAAQLLEECPPGTIAAARRSKDRKKSVLIGILGALLVLALAASIYLLANGGFVTLETVHYEDEIPEGFPVDGESQIRVHY